MKSACMVEVTKPATRPEARSQRFALFPLSVVGEKQWEGGKAGRGVAGRQAESRERKPAWKVENKAEGNRLHRPRRKRSAARACPCQSAFCSEVSSSSRLPCPLFLFFFSFSSLLLLLIFPIFP